MADPNALMRGRDVTEPGIGAVAIVPADGSDLAIATRGLYVGVAGDVACHMVNGDIVTFVALAAGVVHPLSVRRVLESGTTATDIVGVY